MGESSDFDGVPDPRAAGQGQTASDRAPIEVKEEELVRLGAVGAGTSYQMSQTVRRVLILNPEGLNAVAGEMVVAMMESVEAQLAEARNDSKTWQTRAISAEKAAAKLVAAEKPWHEKVRMVVGGGLAASGFTVFGIAVALDGAAAVQVGIAAAVMVVLGIALIAVPWLPKLWARIDRR